MPPLQIMETSHPPTVNKNTLLVVGNLSGKQGLPEIFDALLLLKNTGLRVNLCCVGKVDVAVEKILDNSESYIQIKNQVIFGGHKTFPEAYKNIDNCFAGFALPEYSKNQDDTIAAKLFEYMAAGLPVICPDSATNRQIIDKCHCGICVDAANAEEIADAISYLNRASFQANHMGECGRKAVIDNYNWKTEEAALLRLYKNMLS